MAPDYKQASPVLLYWANHFDKIQWWNTTDSEDMVSVYGFNTCTKKTEISEVFGVDLRNEDIFTANYIWFS